MGEPTPAVTKNEIVQNNDPWGPAQPALKDLLSQAGQAYSATPKTGTYVPPNADQLSAIDWFKNAAPGMSAGVDAVRGNADATLAGKYLNYNQKGYVDPSAAYTKTYNPNVAANPEVDNLIKASLDPLQRDLSHRVMSISDAAQMSGAFGGDRQQLLAGRALGDFNNTAANTAAGIRYTDFDTRRQMSAADWEAEQQRAFQDSEAAKSRTFEGTQADQQRLFQNWQSERDRMMSAGTGYAQANDLALQGGRALDMAGGQERSFQQEKLQDAINSPWTGLDKYSEILKTFSPYGTTTGNSTKTETKAGPSPFTSLLSGALGIAGLFA